MIPRILTVIAAIIVGSVVYASATGTLYGVILAYLVISPTRRVWTRTRSILTTSSTAVGAAALSACVALALNRYFNTGSHTVNPTYFYVGMTSAGIIATLAASAATFHFTRLRYAALTAFLSLICAVVLMVLSAPYGPSVAAQYGNTEYGASQALVDDRDTGDIAATVALVYGLGLLAMLPIRFVYLKLAPASRPAREAQGPGSPRTQKTTDDPDILTAQARLRLDALRRRDDPASAGYATVLVDALALNDIAAMRAALDAERRASAMSALAEAKPIAQSAGKPRVIELSHYLENQRRQATDRDQRAIYEAGMEGERALSQRLLPQLDGSWTALAGYKSPRGEVDMVIVGPPGVCAIEVKNHQGVIDIKRKLWMRTRYDRYGNPTGSPEPIADARRRSPSRQVSDVAESIERSLLYAGAPEAQVRRAVVLTHERAEIGKMTNPGVDAVLRVEQVSPEALFGQSDSALSRSEVAQVAEAIRADHRADRRV